MAEGCCFYYYIVLPGQRINNLLDDIGVDLLVPFRNVARFVCMHDLSHFKRKKKIHVSGRLTTHKYRIHSRNIRTFNLKLRRQNTDADFTRVVQKSTHFSVIDFQYKLHFEPPL